MKLATRINELVKQHGSLRAVALVLRTDVGYLSRLRNGSKANPDEHLLRRMGLRKVVDYQRIEAAP